MPLVGVYLFPHPPIVIPEVGRGREQEASITIQGMKQLSTLLAKEKPDTIVLISPHGPAFQDALSLWIGHTVNGSLMHFGAPLSYRFPVDTALAAAWAREMTLSDLTVITLDEDTAAKYHLDTALDHGALVPLHYIKKEWNKFKLVVMSPGGLSPGDHYRAGMALTRAMDQTGKRYAVVVSGDMSHRLKDDGPYDYHPDGPRFDSMVSDALESNDLKALLSIDHAIVSNAGQCGWLPLHVGAGTLDGRDVTITKLSAEGPFGVGYITASLIPRGSAPSLFGILYETPSIANDKHKSEDSYIQLARRTIQSFIVDGITSTFTELKGDLPPGDVSTMENHRAGAFVSLHIDGALRGCIGTIAPTRRTLGDEICAMAIEACAHDPRFEPVRIDEVELLDVKVDVLQPAEKINDPALLDPQTYGVIVENGFRRGLLLPRLDGIDTVEQQIAIARRKAGIRPNEEVSLSRFKVERHEVK